MTLSEFLKQRRLAKNLSLRELWHLTGRRVSWAMFHKYEHGRSSPKFESMVILSKALDFTLDDAAKHIGVSDEYKLQLSENGPGRSTDTAPTEREQTS